MDNTKISQDTKYYFEVDIIAPDGTKEARHFSWKYGKYGSAFLSLNKAMEVYNTMQNEEPELMQERDSVKDIGYRISKPRIVKETITKTTTKEIVFGEIKEEHKPKFNKEDKVLIVKSKLLLENNYAGMTGTVLDYNEGLKNYKIGLDKAYIKDPIDSIIDIREYWEALELMTEDKYLSKEELKSLLCKFAELKEKNDFAEIFKTIYQIELYKFIQFKAFLEKEKVNRTLNEPTVYMTDKLFGELYRVLIYGVE